MYPWSRRPGEFLCLCDGRLSPRCTIRCDDGGMERGWLTAAVTGGRTQSYQESIKVRHEETKGGLSPRGMQMDGVDG